MCSLLYVLLWYKANAKILFQLKMSPIEWWLYTGLISSYLGLHSWWFLVKQYNIWGALAITYFLHTVIELGLSFYYYDPPTQQQLLGLTLLVLGSGLVLK